MNHLITITLLLLSLTGMGQTDTNSVMSIDSTSPTRIPALDSIYDEFVRVVNSAQPIYYWSDSISIPTYDTIPVMLLVCDTSNMEFRIYNDTLSNFAHLKDHTVTWINAYQVREPYYYWGGPDPNPDGTVYAISIRRTAYNHICYLDKSKKRLGREIVVWDAKQITK